MLNNSLRSIVNNDSILMELERQIKLKHPQFNSTTIIKKEINLPTIIIESAPIFHQVNTEIRKKGFANRVYRVIGELFNLHLVYNKGISIEEKTISFYSKKEFIFDHLKLLFFGVYVIIIFAYIPEIDTLFIKSFEKKPLEMGAFGDL